MVWLIVVNRVLHPGFVLELFLGDVSASQLDFMVFSWPLLCKILLPPLLVPCEFLPETIGLLAAVDGHFEFSVRVAFPPGFMERSYAQYINLILIENLQTQGLHLA